jgi:hypothetical protein
VAKITVEKYFLYEIRHGSVSPIYAKYVLKSLGLKQLREENDRAQS